MHELVQTLREVGSGNNNDALWIKSATLSICLCLRSRRTSLVETVQLNEKLIKGLPEILLVFGAPFPTDCVQLVNEDDSGLLLSGSCEEFTYSLGA